MIKTMTIQVQKLNLLNGKLFQTQKNVDTMYITSKTITKYVSNNKYFLCTPEILYTNAMLYAKDKNSRFLEIRN